MTWTLYQGSCLDPVTGLAMLGDKSVDVVITDPPYEAEAHNKQRRVKDTGDGRNYGTVAKAPIRFPPITEEERDASAMHIGRITRHRALVFCQVEAVHLWRASLERAGMKYRRTIPWIKTDAMPSLHGRWPGQSFESIVLATQSHEPCPHHDPPFMAVVLATAKGSDPCPCGGGALYYVTSKQSDGTHDTEKPTRLMMAMVEDFSKPGDLVADLFAGSGKTGIACRLLGRDFIGWEIDPATHAIAERRLRGQRALVQQHQPELF